MSQTFIQNNTTPPGKHTKLLRSHKFNPQTSRISAKHHTQNLIIPKSLPIFTAPLRFPKLHLYLKRLSEERTERKWKMMNGKLKIKNGKWKNIHDPLSIIKSAKQKNTSDERKNDMWCRVEHVCQAKERICQTKEHICQTKEHVWRTKEWHVM